MARNCRKYFTVSLVPVAALTLAIIFGLGIFTLPILYTELSKKYEYGMVIDAGSSHTAIYVYRLNVPITGDVQQVYTSGVNKGLNEAVNYSEAYDIVSSLLNDSSLRGHIPDKLHGSTQLYLGATAGMRILQLEHPTEAKRILRVAEEAMKKSAFFYRNAVIISGTQEAAGGWATLNYLSHAKQGDVGSMDMGGASTEIAFSVANDASGSEYHLNELLADTPHRIYARSYLCYGYYEARARFLAQLVNDNNNHTVNVSNPCLPVAAFRSYKFTDINTSCVIEPIAKEIFASVIHLPQLTEDHNVTFIGTGNSSQCISKIKTVFNFSSCHPDINCESKKFEAPPVSGKFVGFSGFYYVAEKLKIENFTYNKSYPILAAVNKACDKKGNITDPYCFYGYFTAYLMEEGFGMNASSDWSVKFQEKVNRNSIGWALGYFMNKTMNYPDHPYYETWPYSAADMVVGMVILTILCAIFVIFFLLTFYACRKVLRSNNGYQSIS